MKILLVNKYHYIRGGTETYYFAIADGLRKLGHEVCFFSMKSDLNEPCPQEDYFVSEIDYNTHHSTAENVRLAASLLYSFEAKRKFEELLKAEKPDIVHLNLVHRQISLSILDAPSLRSIPVVFTAHDYNLVCPSYLMLDPSGNVCDDCINGHYFRCIEKCCVKDSRVKSTLAATEAYFLRKHGSYRKIKKIIAPSEFMKKKLLEGGFSPDKVVTMRNFAKNELISQDTIQNKEPFFLYCGRLSKEKGVDIAVEAFLSIAECLPPEWRLVIAGEGPELLTLKEVSSVSPHSCRIEYAGFLKSKEMRCLAERAAFCIASSRCRENMPYSVIESFAASTPVLGSRIGGIPELVIEGHTGFLFEPGNANNLATCMVKAAKLDSTRYEVMKRNCSNYVKTRCNQNGYMEELVKLYTSLLPGSGLVGYRVEK